MGNLRQLRQFIVLVLWGIRMRGNERGGRVRAVPSVPRRVMPLVSRRSGRVWVCLGVCVLPREIILQATRGRIKVTTAGTISGPKSERANTLLQRMVVVCMSTYVHLSTWTMESTFASAGLGTSGVSGSGRAEDVMPSNEGVLNSNW